MTEMLGWIATAVFTGSYFFSRPGLLRAVQIGGAALWVLYGILIGAGAVAAAHAVRLCGHARNHRDVRHHHAQLGHSARPD